MSVEFRSVDMLDGTYFLIKVLRTASEFSVPEIELGLIRLDDEIQRLRKQLEDYKTACEQKQEVIYGLMKQVADQQAEIKDMKTGGLI